MNSGLQDDSRSDPGRRHIVEMLEFGSVHGLADLAQRRLQTLFERGMIERQCQNRSRGFVALDRPSEQIGDVIHSRCEKRAASKNAIVIGIDPDQAGVAGLDPGAALIGVGRACDERRI